MKLLLVLSLALAAADALPGFLRGAASHDVTPSMAPGRRKLPHYPTYSGYRWCQKGSETCAVGYWKPNKDAYYYTFKKVAEDECDAAATGKFTHSPATDALRAQRRRGLQADADADAETAGGADAEALAQAHEEAVWHHLGRQEVH